MAFWNARDRLLRDRAQPSLPSWTTSTELESNFEQSKSVEREGWKRGLGDRLNLSGVGMEMDQGGGGPINVGGYSSFFYQTQQTEGRAGG